MENLIEICNVIDIPLNGAIGRTVSREGRTVHLIILKHADRVLVFLNSCPHTGIRLDWRPDDFLDVSETYLQCAMHGALFDPPTGRCIAGPCSGDHLVEVPVVVDSGVIYLSADAEIPASAALP